MVQEGWKILRNLFGSEKEEDCVKCVESFREQMGMFDQGPFKTRHLPLTQVLLLHLFVYVLLNLFIYFF